MTKSSTFAGIGMILMYVILSVGIFQSLDEDAFISFRYVDQLVEGNGLVFNQESKVEGFSNFLWIVILYPFKALGCSLIIISRVLGMLFGLGSAFMVVRFTKKLMPEDRILPWAVGYWYVLSIPVIWWSQGGMETSLIAFEILAMTYFMAFGNKSWLWGGVWLVLSAMTRPEAHLFIPLYFFWIITKKRNEGAIKGITLVLVTLGVYHLLRYSYYGYLLPTPAAMKVTGSFALGFDYLWSFFIHGHYFWAIPFFLRAVFSWEQRSATLPLGTVVLAYLFFILYAGGDYKPHFRFMVPFLAPFMILSALGLHMMARLFGSKGKKLLTYFVTFLLILLPLSFYKGWEDSPPSRSIIIKGLYQWFDCLKRQVSTYTTNYDYSYHPYLGQWIKKNFPSTTLITYEQMGQVPYFAGIDYHFIDLGGLMDRYIADCYKKARPPSLCTFFSQILDHVTLGKARGMVNKFKSLCPHGEPDMIQEIVRYVLSKQSEVVMVTGFISQWYPWKYLWNDPSFRNNYVLTQIFGYSPGAYRENIGDFDLETLNTIIFFRKDFNLADPLKKKCRFSDVSHSLFYHYTEQDEVKEWLKKKYPDLLALTH